MAHTSSVFNITHFRGRNDDGTETTATWVTALDTDWAQQVDENFRVRLQVEEVSGNASSNDTFQWQYSLNSGTWTNITTTSSVIRAFQSGNASFVDEADCTQQISAGGTFNTNNNGQCEDGQTSGADFAASSISEVELCCQLRSADVSIGDTIEIRVLISTVAPSGTPVLPTITASNVLPLECTPGTFALTGVANAFSRALNLELSAGSFALTGIDIAFERGIVFDADPAHGKLTGYMDGSGFITDSNSYWTDDEKAADGSLSTYAYTDLDAGSSVNTLRIKGWSKGVTGFEIIGAETRVYGVSYGISSLLSTYFTYGAGSDWIGNDVFPSSGVPEWSSWANTDTPVVGWSALNESDFEVWLRGDNGDVLAVRAYKYEVRFEYDVGFILSGQDASLKRGYSLSADSGVFKVRGGGQTSDDYIFDASDSGPTDNSNNWTDDANSVDGNDATFAYTTTDGPTNDLFSTGTDAPGTGDPITEIQARLKGRASDANAIAEIIIVVRDGGTFLGNNRVHQHEGVAWSDWKTIQDGGYDHPFNGLFWSEVQALTVSAYGYEGAGGQHRLYQSEIRVWSGNDVEFTYNSGPAQLSAETGTFLLTGVAADLDFAHTLNADPPHGKLTGYMDGSVFITDTNSYWTDDEKAADGSLSTYAYTDLNANEYDENTLRIKGWSEGVTGFEIIGAETRVYGLSNNGISELIPYFTYGPGTDGINLDFFPGSGVPEWSSWFGTFTPVVGWSALNESDFEVWFRGEDGDAQTVRAYKYEVRFEYDVGFLLLGQDASFKRGHSLSADAGSFDLTGVDATFKNAWQVEADEGTYDLTGIDANLNRGIVLEADPQTYTLSGVDAELKQTVALSADAGTFSLAGQDVQFAFDMDAVAQSYSLTGIDANFSRDLVLEADPQTYSLTGSNAEFALTEAMPANTGVFAMTGVDVALQRSIIEAFDAGTFTLTGVDATLGYGEVFAVEAGTYTLTGIDAEFLYSVTFDAEAGSYSVTGIAADLDYGRVIPAEAGSYALTGVDAAIDYMGTFQVEAGAFSVSGVDAALKRALIVEIDTQSFNVAGQDADLNVTDLFPAETGALSLTGAGADLRLSLRLEASPLALSVSGENADLDYGKVLAGDTQTFAVSGVDVAFQRGILIDAESAAFALTGQPVELPLGLVLSADAGAFDVTGVDLGFLNAWSLSADAGSFALTGIDANLNEGVAITAETGAFAVTGVDIATTADWVIPFETGEILLTGADASFASTGALPAEPGGFIVSGQAADLLRGIVLEANVGTFALAGIDAALETQFSIGAELGTFALTGIDSDLIRDAALNAETATFNLAGQDLAFLTDRVLDAEAAAFTLTGADAEFALDLIADASAGVFALTGADATLTLIESDSLAATPGVYAVSGVEASLQAQQKVELAPGSYALTGQDAALGRGYDLEAEQGTFALAGQDVDTQRHFVIVGEAGAFDVQGADAEFKRQRRLDCAAGDFAFSGEDAALNLARTFDAETGSFDLIGVDVSLDVTAASFDAETGSFVISGNVVDFDYSGECDFEGLAEILRAAFDKLLTFTYSPQPEILWPGIQDTPPQTGLWLEPRLLPKANRNMVWDNCGSVDTKGILQIRVYFRPGQGLIEPSELADALIDFFPKGTEFGPVRVRKRPWATRAVVDDSSKLYMPVNVSYKGLT